tara:strand:+ start:257 stop:1303 length:1047 start_codon:yes stop_codon:yes gene_type:complete
MPYERPSLSELQDSIKNDIETKLQTGPLLKRSFLYVIAMVVAGACHMIYGFIDWIYKQMFLDTADAENVIREASLYGIKRSKPTFASGSIRFEGVNGSIIPSGTVVKRSDGLQFSTTESVTISAGIADAQAQALNAGELANTETGVKLDLIVSLAGVDAQATSQSIENGRDIESIESLRSRIKTRKAEPPHGGALADYRDWSLSINGITRAFPIANGQGVGTVDVILVDDSQSPPVPNTEAINSTQAYLDEVKPVTCDVAAIPVQVEAVNIEISLTPDSADIRAAVTANLEDLFRRLTEPSSVMLISKIREAVSTAAGENDNTVVSPTGDVTPTGRNMLVLGDVTWTS